MRASRTAGAALILAAILTLPVSCAKDPSLDGPFIELANRYLEGLRELRPAWSTNLGDHRFDHLWPDRSPAGISRMVAFQRAYLDSLAGIDPEGLDQGNRIDYDILRERIEASLFRLQEIREHQWNPLVYNVGNGIYNLLARDYAPVADRLGSLKARLEGVPEVLAVAKQNLGNPPRIHTETAINQNQGTLKLVLDGLKPYLEQVPELEDEFVGVRARTISALEEYGRWLEEELLPRSTGDFRLGPEKYRRKLRYALASDLAPAEILAEAERDLATTLQEMYVVAKPLFDRFFPDRVYKQAPALKEVIKAVLDRLAQDHPNSDNIVALGRQSLDRCTEFVRQQNLVTVPDEPIDLIVMPEHQRGLWIAYCDSPGPLEERGQTFYAISPTPKDWDAERTASFYREYNNYMLENLTIHEAMPGHYLQIAHANQFVAPTLIRAIFSSGTFVEGWATYAERFMADAGYGGPEVKLQQLKMRLRLIINAIIDQKIHAGQMQEQEAIDLMMSQGFQEEGEAVGKWRRACLTSAQLSTYYVGNIEVNRIRTDYEAKQGNSFQLKEFHDQMLSFGSPPPKYLRTLLGL